MNVEKISETLEKIEQFIQLFQATYTQELGMKPDEKTRLQVLGIDWQDGLTMRIKKTEPSSEALERACDKIAARLFKTATNYSVKFSSINQAIEALSKIKTDHS